MFQTQDVEKIKTHNLYSTTLFQEKMWKNIIQPDNMAGVHCTIDTYDYKHTLKT